MFNFAGITHIQKINYPQGKAHGKYSLVGSVPRGCYDIVPADRSSVIGGRAFTTQAGTMMPKARYYDTKADAIADIVANGGKVCELDGCACRKVA